MKDKLKEKNELEKNLEEFSYEEAVIKLEDIVRKLEDTNVPLEEALSSFQEGITLSRYCRNKLAEIEFKVDYLLKEEEKQSQFNDDHKICEKD